MIQQTTQTVWGYGYGMARTVGRVTLGADGYETLGPMVFTLDPANVGLWTVDLDVQGESYIRYISARVLFSNNDDLQAQAVIDPDPNIPFGSRLLVQQEAPTFRQISP